MPVIPDTRDKKDKYTRIEGLLEPLNRAGLLSFNTAESDNPDMKRLKAQFKGFSRKQRRMDGPDMVEGGGYLLRQRADAEAATGFYTVKRNNKYRL